jgi:arabinofuranan 3-O-arabinosyltransferase
MTIKQPEHAIADTELTAPIPTTVDREPIAQQADGGSGHRPPRSGSSAGDGDGARTAGRWWPFGVWLLALVLFVANSPGKMIFDTKLGVDIDPVGFYQRLAHLWNPLQWFGGLQDQYVGYAFPMGTFYLLGHLAHVPVWLTERLWMSVLIAAGFWGLLRLAERLRIGTARTRLISAAVFALWPTYTILIGSTSVAVLPGLLVPWAVLPLVTAARGGSTRVAAARSGVAVLAMGGVNAVCTIAAITLPFLYILTRKRGKRQLSLALWWVLAVALATAWWVITLLLQGKYGFNFLPYIEQAANTTQTTSAATVLRGSGNWVAYLHFGNAWLSAGWAVVSTPLIIGASTMAAAVGLAGLAWRDLPDGKWLRLGAGLGVLVPLAGYAGSMGGLFHGTVQQLLDGPLAPFRNVFKFEPILAVALTLGIAHALGKLGRHWAGRRFYQRCKGISRILAVVSTAAVLIGLAQPYLTGQVLQPGAFSSVPSYWTDAANFLGANSPNAPTLVTPADSHGTYAWGTTVDEPLEPLAKSPWVQRELVPFSGAGSATMLKTAEDALEAGTAQPGLASYLARAGIRYVLVRNDLDPTQLDYTPPEVIHQTLEQSGFGRVAAFGPQTTGGYVYSGTALTVQGIMRLYPAVEIYQATQQPATPAGPVTAQPVDSAMQVNGDPGTLLQLANQGVLTDQAVIANGDQAATTPATQVVTDGMRRQDTAFGLIQHNSSYTYTATGTNPADDSHGASGEPPRQLLSDYASGNQTVAELSGAADVTASSYGSWLWEMPQYDPVNAFDGNADTAWTEGRPDDAAGQWLGIDFQYPLDLPATVPIRLLDDTSFRPLISRVVTTTESGSATTELAATGAPQSLRVPPGPSSWLRVTIEATTNGITGGPAAGIREIAVPGVQVTRYLHAAAIAGTDPTVVSFHRDTVSPRPLAATQPETQLARTFSTGSAQTMPVSATAVAVPGAALDTLLDRYRTGPPGLTATASSTWGSLPEFRPSNLVDNNWETAWLAGAPDPVLHLSWSGLRTIDEIALVPAGGVANTPTRIRISGTNGTREVAVPNTSTTPVPATSDLKFPALTTDHLDISFPGLMSSSSFAPAVGASVPLLVGVAELNVPALADLRAGEPDANTPVTLPCGQGPDLVVDGKTYPTSAHGTLGDLTAFRPVTVTVCTPDDTVALASGRHVVSSPGSGPLSISDLTLGKAAPQASQARDVRVTSWGPEDRQVTVGAGAKTYLEVHETFNAGWTASLNGTPLTPVQLDGWQQGFVVPAGSGGTVTLSFAPGARYRLALAISAGGVAVLVLGALLRGRRRRGTPGVNIEPAAGRTSRAGVWAALIAVTTLLVVVGGIAAVLVPILAGLGYLRPRWLPVVAGVAMVGAGIFAIIGVVSHGIAAGYGALGGPAQVFALAALAAALVPWLFSRREAQP